MEQFVALSTVGEALILVLQPPNLSHNRLRHQRIRGAKHGSSRSYWLATCQTTQDLEP